MFVCVRGRAAGRLILQADSKLYTEGQKRPEKPGLRRGAGALALAGDKTRLKGT